MDEDGWIVLSGLGVALIDTNWRCLPLRLGGADDVVQLLRTPDGDGLVVVEADRGVHVWRKRAEPTALGAFGRWEAWWIVVIGLLAPIIASLISPHRGGTTAAAKRTRIAAYLLAGSAGVVLANWLISRSVGQLWGGDGAAYPWAVEIPVLALLVLAPVGMLVRVKGWRVFGTVALLAVAGALGMSFATTFAGATGISLASIPVYQGFLGVPYWSANAWVIPAIFATGLLAAVAASVIHLVFGDAEKAGSGRLSLVAVLEKCGMSEFVQRTRRSLGPQSQTLDEAPHEISEDTVCLTCEYNLRGLGSDGRCPECGTAIGRSLRGDFLRFADPQYVRALAKGVTLMLWGVAVGIVGVILRSGPGAATDESGVGAITDIIASLVTMIGAWIVTTPDPNKLDAAKTFTARRLIRLFAVLSLGYMLMNLVQVLAQQTTSMSGATSAILTACGLVFGACWIISFLAQLSYFRSLAVRIPNPSVAASTRRLLWGFIIFASVMVFGGAISALAAATGFAPDALAAMFMTVPSSFGGIGLVICLLWWVVMLARYRQDFVAQAELAEQTWAPVPVENLIGDTENEESGQAGADQTD